MSVPEGLARPHRILALLPVLAAFVFVIGSLLLALTHLEAKGGAPQASAPNSQVATGQAPQTRDAYTAKDFTEPNRQ